MFKFLTIKNLLLGALFVLMLFSVFSMAMSAYWLSTSAKFNIDATDKVIFKGVEAIDFWNNNKMYMITPTVLNVMGVLLVITLVYVT